MSTSNPTPPPSIDERNAIADLVREAIGYEQGLWRTFVDLRGKPKEVLEGYLTGNRKYVSPFKLLTTSLSVWILLNGFLIDWYAIWNQIITGVMDQEIQLIAWLKDMDAAARASLEARVAEKPITKIVTQIAGDLFSKWYVPFALLSIISGTWLFNRRYPSPEVSFKRALAILSYSVGSNMPIYLAISLAFGLNVWFASGLIFLILPLALAGKTSFVNYAPVSSFFDENGRQREKQLMRSVFIIVLVLEALLTVGYILYFYYLP